MIFKMKNKISKTFLRFRNFNKTADQQEFTPAWDNTQELEQDKTDKIKSKNSKKSIKKIPTLPRLKELVGEDRFFGGKRLFVDLIPKTCCFTNARYAVHPADWDRIRRFVYQRAQNRCECCDTKGRIEAHERWYFDEQRKIQKLTRIIALCKSCHETTHIGLARVKGREEAAIGHLMAITGMTGDQAKKHIEAAFSLCEKRNQHEWVLDLSIITNSGIRLVQVVDTKQRKAIAEEKSSQFESNTRDTLLPRIEKLIGEDRFFGGSRLFVDLIPKTCWFTNVRYAVDPDDWDRLRRFIYRRAYYRCECCDTRAPIEAHERWHFDERRKIQTLMRIIALCKPCHEATHIGLARIKGRGEAAMTHLMAVTGMNNQQAKQHIEDAFILWEKRNQHEWVLDLSIITNSGIRLARVVDKQERKTIAEEKIAQIHQNGRDAAFIPKQKTNFKQRGTNLSLDNKKIKQLAQKETTALISRPLTNNTTDYPRPIFKQKNALIPQNDHDAASISKQKTSSQQIGTNFFLGNKNSKNIVPQETTISLTKQRKIIIAPFT